jgi:hypothetical protein
MKVSFEYIGFIMSEELLIKKIGKSKFILLPEQYGMFYILPDTDMEIKLRCKLCNAKNEPDDVVKLLIGNKTMMGLIECKPCKANSLIGFRKKTIIDFIEETNINPKLIEEHWGYVASMSNN